MPAVTVVFESFGFRPNATAQPPPPRQPHAEKHSPTRSQAVGPPRLAAYFCCAFDWFIYTHVAVLRFAYVVALSWS